LVSRKNATLRDPVIEQQVSLLVKKAILLTYNKNKTMKTLIITNEIYQNWIDAEKQMAIYDGDDHPAVISHGEIGYAIFGDNLEQTRTWIYDNCENPITIEDLKQFEK
jgi:hypothetical protein